ACDGDPLQRQAEDGARPLEGDEGSLEALQRARQHDAEQPDGVLREQPLEHARAVRGDRARGAPARRVARLPLQARLPETRRRAFLEDDAGRVDARGAQARLRPRGHEPHSAPRKEVRLMADRTIQLRVKRQDSPNAPARWEEFTLPYRSDMNVIICLQEVQRNPVTSSPRRRAS